MLDVTLCYVMRFHVRCNIMRFYVRCYVMLYYEILCKMLRYIMFWDFMLDVILWYFMLDVTLCYVLVEMFYIEDQNKSKTLRPSRPKRCASQAGRRRQSRAPPTSRRRRRPPTGSSFRATAWPSSARGRTSTRWRVRRGRASRRVRGRCTSRRLPKIRPECQGGQQPQITVITVLMETVQWGMCAKAEVGC